MSYRIKIQTLKMYWMASVGLVNFLSYQNINKSADLLSHRSWYRSHVLLFNNTLQILPQAVGLLGSVIGLCDSGIKKGTSASIIYSFIIVSV